MIMLKDALQTAKKVKPLFLVSTDPGGMPVVADVDDVQLTEKGQISVAGWFPEEMVSNLSRNPDLSLVVWDPETNSQYRLTGVMKNIAMTAILDGYVPKIERGRNIPQVRWAIEAEIHQVTGEKHYLGPSRRSRKKTATVKEGTPPPRPENNEFSDDLLRAENEGFPLSKIFDSTKGKKRNGCVNGQT